ncbi:zinc ribbon domain-containing protein [Deinococcus sonorensis]|uniref:Zinc ribbon domain-containing protein n=2 Tax=Deinococcus sonorensis TaxID=309891 RepID=A0AAU7UFB3_9DEIO
MQPQTYILPIDRSANPVIERWVKDGQLRATDEQLPGTNGRVYALSPALLSTVCAADDFHLNVGRERIGVPIYRMPEWEYSSIVRASDTFHQHRIAHLIQPLLVSQQVFQADRWIANVIDAVAGAPLVGPQPLTVGEQWSDDGRFVPEATRLIRRHAFWMLQLGFELPPTRDLDGHGLVLGIDVGLRPLVTVALEGDGSWATGGIVRFTPAIWRQLSVAAIAAGVDTVLVKRTARLLRYSAARELIEEGFLVPVAQTARAVVAERLNYAGFERHIVRQMREEAIRDFLTAWLPQRLHAWGIQFVPTDPAFTSRDCSRIGCNHRNHPSEEEERIEIFVCELCGHSMNIHANAALNILRRGLPEVRG